jgi:hypothetical protein
MTTIAIPQADAEALVAANEALTAKVAELTTRAEAAEKAPKTAAATDAVIDEAVTFLNSKGLVSKEAIASVKAAMARDGLLPYLKKATDLYISAKVAAEKAATDTKTGTGVTRVGHEDKVAGQPAEKAPTAMELAAERFRQRIMGT